MAYRKRQTYGILGSIAVQHSVDIEFNVHEYSTSNSDIMNSIRQITEENEFETGLRALTNKSLELKKIEAKKSINLKDGQC